MKPKRISFVFLAFFTAFVGLVFINPFSAQAKQPKKYKAKAVKPMTPSKTGRALLDSLLNELPRKGEASDTSGVGLLNRISYEYAYIEPDMGLRYAERALALARSINFRDGESYALNCYGVNLLRKSRFDEAIIYYKSALKIAEETGNKTQMCGYSSNLGRAFLRKQDSASAIGYFDNALRIAREMNDKKMILSQLVAIGEFFYRFLDYTRALDYFGMSLKLSVELNDKSKTSTSYRMIAEIYTFLSDNSKALDNLQKAAQVAEEIGDKFNMAVCYHSIGKYNNDISDYKQAFIFYDKALGLFEELSYDAGISSVLIGKGATHHRMSQYPEAISCFNRAIEILEKLGDKSSISICLGNLGVVYSSMNNYEQALKSYQNSLKISIETGNKQMISKNTGDIGGIYSRMGDYPKAIEHFEKALKLAREVNQKDIVVMMLSRLGGAYGRLAISEKDTTHYKKAMDFLEQALKVARETNNKYLIASELTQIAFYIDKEMHKYKEALDKLFMALDMYREMGVKDTVNTMGSIAAVYKDMADYPRALEYFEKAQKVAREQNNEYMVNLEQAFIGWTLLEMSEDKNIKDSSAWRSNLVKAADYMDKSIKYFGESNDLITKMNFLLRLERAYSALGIYDKALTAYKEARTMQDSLFSSENRKKIAELDAKRELEVKAKENVILQQKTEFQQLALSKQKQDYQLLNTQHKVQALEIVKKNGDLVLLQKDKNIKDLELKKTKAEGDKKAKDIAFLTKESQYQSVVRNSLVGAFAFASAIALLVFFFLRRKSRDNKKLVELNEAIKTEQDKSESLLHNILPVPVAVKLKEGEKHVSDYFEEASIVFIDIVDFSLFSSNTTPERLIEVLNNVYTEFDSIAEKYGLEKIKTIGDCYMAVSGVPVRNPNHAMDAARFATEAMSSMNGKDFGDGRNIYFRTGIDCGPVIAGVIGEKKFIYDLWGDAVNTASRMEEFGVTGRIQCTDRFRSAYYNSDGHDSMFSFKERGKIEIKGKGYMNTYFLEKAGTHASEIAF